MYILLPFTYFYGILFLMMTECTLSQHILCNLLCSTQKPVLLYGMTVIVRTPYHHINKSHAWSILDHLALLYGKTCHSWMAGMEICMLGALKAVLGRKIINKWPKTSFSWRKSSHYCSCHFKNWK